MRCGMNHSKISHAHKLQQHGMYVCHLNAAALQCQLTHPLLHCCIVLVLRSEVQCACGALITCPGNTTASRTPWRRITYKVQPYEDNYVDSTFLQQLVMNPNVSTLSYYTLALHTAAITQRIATLAVFLCVFTALFNEKLQTTPLITLDIFLLFAACTLYLYMQHTRSAAQASPRTAYSTPRVATANNTPVIPLSLTRYYIRFFMAHTKRLLFFIGCLLGLSPVLRTLTAAYSSDTIWALTTLLCTLHLILHDYSFINQATARTEPEFQGTISLNAGIFASALLASRLTTSENVFAFLLFAFELFAGLPLLNHHIRVSDSCTLLSLHQQHSHDPTSCVARAICVRLR